jgi:predicted phage terminase large subunit-like protein
MNYVIDNPAELANIEITRAQAIGESLQHEDRLDAARNNFLPYVRHLWPTVYNDDGTIRAGFVPGAHHEIVANKFDRIISGDLKRLIINMPPRHRLTLCTPVATTKGWSTIGDVEIGDFVFSPSGEPVEVTGKSNVYEEEIYRVETRDGQTVECDGDHLWNVKFVGGGSKFGDYSTRDLFRKLSEGAWVKYSNYPRLPDVSPIEYPEADLLIPPYILGAWLGDGASGCGTMAAHPNDAPHIRYRFESEGIPTTDLSHDKIFGTKSLMVKLREIGVLDSKHIPEIYLTASVEQRLALMQGLIDTDGSVGIDGKCVFYTSLPDLADQFLELVHSFGVCASITSRQTNYEGVPSKASYRINFKLKDAASLPRKRERTRNHITNNGRTIRVFKTDKVEKVQCLKITNDDGLFLVGKGYVVTHNTKSEFASIYLPSYFVGRNPGGYIMQATHSSELSLKFGGKVRDLVKRKEYLELFPKTTLKPDATARGRWMTTGGGEYYAAGVGTNIAGHGADLFIIDDPHSEQHAESPTTLDSHYEWYRGGPRQRLQPGGAIVLVMTRWSKKDLTARVLEAMGEENADVWEIVEFPAILDSGRSLWPAYWPLDQLLATKASVGTAKWLAEYMQNPTAEEGAILKREYWQKWPHAKPPEVEYILQSWDTAFLADERADYSACTTWGIFKREKREKGDTPEHIILLDAKKGRWEFPELKRIALAEHQKWDPDMTIIENKASGAPLTQELRAIGIPVVHFNPIKGRDKVARANAVSPTFESGLVWYPDKNFATDVIEECADFPYGDHDDYVDSVTQAMLRFRQGGFITHPSDYEDEEEKFTKKRRKAYYG